MKLSLIALALIAALIGGTGYVRAHPPLPPGCSQATPAGCVYTPTVSFAQTGVFDTVLTDAARNNYQLPVRVRYPIGATGPLPVIIYNHGGGSSASAGRQPNSQPWPTAWAKAGYVVISPSRAPLAALTQAQSDECAANGWPAPACRSLQAWLIYGPVNTDFLIGRIFQLGSLHPPLSGLMDPTRVIVAGWSGGSTIALANSGALRRFIDGGATYDQSTDAPIGFFGISTMGPEYAGYTGGFFSEAYDAIDARPFITITGKGDIKDGKPTEPRTTAWLRSAPGDKFLSYDRLFAANHSTMNLSNCTTGARLVHCNWMRSVGLAFVDAVAGNRAVARAWLASDAYETLTAGNIEFHRR